VSLIFLGELALPIRAVSEHPFALAVAVGNVPSRVALNSALEGVCVGGSENLARSKIKSRVYHSDYLSFFYTYIIPHFRRKVNRQIAQSFAKKIVQGAGNSQIPLAPALCERLAKRKAPPFRERRLLPRVSQSVETAIVVGTILARAISGKHRLFQISEVEPFTRVNLRRLIDNLTCLIVYDVNRGKVLKVMFRILTKRGSEVDSTHFRIEGEDVLAVGKIYDNFKHFVCLLVISFLHLYYNTKPLVCQEVL
jgi:hypothetical protein